MSAFDFSILHDSILRERSAGIVTVDHRPLGSFSVDTYVSMLGFTPLGGKWLSIDREQALRVAQRILERDLAYNAPLMDAGRARLLANGFLSLFSANGSRYHTNGSLTPGSSEWNPITKSTFDHGIVVYDNQNIGIIWVQDED